MNRNYLRKVSANRSVIAGLFSSIIMVICLLGFSPSATAQGSISVSGKVTNASGEALAGISVTAKGTGQGTATSATGDYIITVADNGTLVFSSVGYDEQEIAVAGNPVINVVMRTSTKLMDQVVVVGYGTQRKIDVTGSVSSVKGAEISKQSSQNAVSSLQGKVAGVSITNNGQPGASPQVRIRGVGSISNTNPLYIVDGTIVSDLSFLNPNDIESMDILKDASSLSIYGVRAANGVILVTTKKGYIGKPKFNYTAFAGAQIVTNKVKMASARKYATLINEKLGTPTVSEYPTTNWYDEILRGAALSHNHQLSVMGGVRKLSYNASAGFFNQQGLVNDNVYNKGTAKVQLDYKPTTKLKFGLQGIYYNYHSTDIPGDIFYQAYVAPSIFAVKKANGYYGDPADYNVGNFPNPMASLDWFNRKSKGRTYIGTVYGEYKFVKNFTFRSSFSYTDGSYQSRSYTRKDSLTTIQFSNKSSLSRDTTAERKWLWENTLTYDRTINKHRFKVLAGYSATEEKTVINQWSATDVPFNGESSLEIANGDPASVRHVIDPASGRPRFASYFGRVNYAYSDRYLLTATIRHDASSKFPSYSRGAFFPSVGAGWVISKEKFMENQKTFNVLKLKASWGKLGNANIPSNVAVARVDSGGTYNYVFAGNNGEVWHGANNTIFPPKTLFWEKVEETDIGIEMVLMGNRLSIDLDYYNRTTKDGLFELPILGTVGSSSTSVLGNFASFNNKGFELAANWNSSPVIDPESRKLRYTVGLNLSTNINKVVSVEGGNIDLYGGGLPVGGYRVTVARVGEPIGSYYGYEVDGIFQTSAEVTGSAQPFAKPGDFRYKDQNNDGFIDAKDKVILGNPNPKLTYGLNMGFNLRQWDLQLDIQGVASVDVYNATKGIRIGNENYTEDFYQNRWHGAGTSNTYPSAYLNGANLDPNSWYVEPGDYVRVRNIQLGYTVRKSLLKRLKIEKLRFYANAQNPYTYFKYKGFTPEIGGSTPMTSGIDLNVYPLSATYNIGVNLTF